MKQSLFYDIIKSYERKEEFSVKEKIRIGYIGLGRRGTSVLRRCIALMPDVEVKTVCDLSEERMERAAEYLRDLGGYSPEKTTDYQQILADPHIDAVMIMTGWSGRPKIATEAMRAGKYVGVEVGCADTLEECFELVRAYEETGVPVMMMENCCYGRRELMVMNMVKQGLFGELVHGTGGYHHYLNEMELFKNIDEETPAHYRLPRYQTDNRENYPTHALGPLSKTFGIHRGNRMVSLISVASKARGLKQFAKDHVKNPHYAEIDYNQGDIVNTVITCANGETILLTLDTTLPRAYYSRNYSIRGTKGMSDENTKTVYLEGMEEEVMDNESYFYETYDHPLHREFQSLGPRGGHGGMDWLVCRAFVESVKAGTETPIDAYDTAAWLAIGCLSEESLKTGAAVEFPDFTHGLWKTDRPVAEGKYCLDKICEDKKLPIFPEGALK